MQHVFPLCIVLCGWCLSHTACLGRRHGDNQVLLVCWFVFLFVCLFARFFVCLLAPMNGIMKLCNPGQLFTVNFAPPPLQCRRRQARLWHINTQVFFPSQMSVMIAIPVYQASARRGWFGPNNMFVWCDTAPFPLLLVALSHFLLLWYVCLNQMGSIYMAHKHLEQV